MKNNRRSAFDEDDDPPVRPKRKLRSIEEDGDLGEWK
jgi:hypothetical protein